MLAPLWIHMGWACATVDKRADIEESIHREIWERDRGRGEIEGGVKFRGGSSVLEKKQEWERGKRRNPRLKGYNKKGVIHSSILLHTPRTPASLAPPWQPLVHMDLKDANVDDALLFIYEARYGVCFWMGLFVKIILIKRVQLKNCSPFLSFLISHQWHEPSRGLKVSVWARWKGMELV
jgi:hypothetical protein